MYHHMQLHGEEPKLLLMLHAIHIDICNGQVIEIRVQFAMVD